LSPETELPELIYVPCAEHVADASEARPLMRRLADGQLLLPTYSTIDILYAAWGDKHPWLVLPSASLDALHDTQNFDLVGVDLVPDENERDAGDV
jgi:hypothetical protein